MKQICNHELKKKERLVRGVCINCYAKILKQENANYKKLQQENTKNFYRRVGSVISNKTRTPGQRNYRIEALIKLGSRCNRCGRDDVRVLQIDHVNGDGKKERNIRKSINRNIALGLTDLSRYQLLCANCNWIKRWENNEGKNREDFNAYLININKQINKKEVQNEP